MHPKTLSHTRPWQVSLAVILMTMLGVMLVSGCESGDVTARDAHERLFEKGLMLGIFISSCIHQHGRTWYETSLGQEENHVTVHRLFQARDRLITGKEADCQRIAQVIRQETNAQ